MVVKLGARVVPNECGARKKDYQSHSEEKQKWNNGLATASVEKLHGDSNRSSTRLARRECDGAPCVWGWKHAGSIGLDSGAKVRYT